jgi:TPR repeat protein
MRRRAEAAPGLIPERTRRPPPGAVAAKLYRSAPSFRFLVDFAALGWITLAVLAFQPGLLRLRDGVNAAPGEQRAAAVTRSEGRGQDTRGEALRQAMGQAGAPSAAAAAPAPRDYHLDERAFATSEADLRPRLIEAAALYQAHSPSSALLTRLDGLSSTDPGVQLLRGLATIGLGGRQNAAQGLELVETSARAGSTAAMTLLGISRITPPGFLPADPRGGREWLQRAADLGDPQAAVILGRAYATGWAGISDPARAATLYRRAHDAGNSEASMRLAELYIWGTGVKRDLGEAAGVIRVCAERGSVDCVAARGMFLGIGAMTGWEPSYDEAVVWLTRAAEAGHAPAMEMLADIHLQLAKAEPLHDPGRGFSWLQRCAELKRMTCLYGVARCYREGVGTEADPQKAYSYYLLAARAGHPKAAAELRALRKNLTPAQIRRAQLQADGIKGGMGDSILPASDRSSPKPVYDAQNLYEDPRAVTDAPQ